MKPGGKRKSGKKLLTLSFWDDLDSLFTPPLHMHGMVDEKQRKFKIRIRPSKRNYIGLFFSLVGFLLILLCLVGSRTGSSKGLHFARLTERPAGPLTIYVGWQGYCVEQSSDVECRTDDGVMMMPFGKWSTGSQ